MPFALFFLRVHRPWLHRMSNKFVVVIEVAHETLVVVVQSGCFDHFNLVFTNFKSSEKDLLHH